MESQSSRPEQQLNEYNDVSTVRAHMCGMPLKNFYTVCAEIRGTCHVACGGSTEKTNSIRRSDKEATDDRDTGDGPRCAGRCWSHAAPAVRRSDFDLTRRGAVSLPGFHYESDAYMVSTRQNPAPVKRYPAPRLHDVVDSRGDVVHVTSWLLGHSILALDSTHRTQKVARPVRYPDTAPGETKDKLF